MVNIPHGWWPSQYIEGHYRDLLASSATMKIRDKAREIQWDEALRRSNPMADILGETTFSYSTDTLFDCLCEVKRDEEK